MVSLVHVLSSIYRVTLV